MNQLSLETLRAPVGNSESVLCPPKLHFFVFRIAQFVERLFDFGICARRERQEGAIIHLGNQGGQMSRMVEIENSSNLSHYDWQCVCACVWLEVIFFILLFFF